MGCEITGVYGRRCHPRGWRPRAGTLLCILSGHWCRDRPGCLQTPPHQGVGAAGSSGRAGAGGYGPAWAQVCVWTWLRRAGGPGREDTHVMSTPCLCRRPLGEHLGGLSLAETLLASSPKRSALSPPGSGAHLSGPVPSRPVKGTSNVGGTRLSQGIDSAGGTPVHISQCLS